MSSQGIASAIKRRTRPPEELRVRSTTINDKCACSCARESNGST